MRTHIEVLECDEAGDKFPVNEVVRLVDGPEAPVRVVGCIQARAEGSV